MQVYHWTKRLRSFPPARIGELSTPPYIDRRQSSPRNCAGSLYLEQKPTRGERGAPAYRAVPARSSTAPPPRAPLTTYPTFGSPTIPIFRDVPNLPMIGCDLTPSPPFFGGIWKHRGGHDEGPATAQGPAAHPQTPSPPGERRSR